MTPDARRPQAPCTPASALPDDSAEPLNSTFLVPAPSRSRPPGACRPAHPRAPAPPLPGLLRTPAAATRSLPTQSGTPGSSPGNHSAPETRCCRPATTGPDPQSCTSAPLAQRQMDLSQTAPPSTPVGSDNPVLPPPRQCAVPPPRPQAPALHKRPECTPACSRSAGL